MSSTTPIVYRASVFRIVISSAYFLLFGVLAVVGVGSAFVPGEERLVPVAPFSLVALYFLVATLTTRVALFSDRLEVTRFGRTKIVRLSEIRARRVLDNRKAVNLILLLTKDGGPRIRIAAPFEIDAQLTEWLNRIPNLDRVDLAASLRAIHDNELLGATVSDRMRALASSRPISWVINVVAVDVAVWALFFPHPYRFVVFVLSILPWVAVAAIWFSRELLRADGNWADVRPNLAIAFVVPALVLFLRGSSDYDLVRAWSLAPASLATTFLLFSAILIASRSARSRGGTLVLPGVSALGYGYGAAIEANALLDQSGGSVYAARVLGRSVHQGRHRSYSVRMELPWAYGGASEIKVSQDTYDATRIYDRVHVVQRSGALGAPWYFVQEWQAREARRFPF